MVLVMRVIRKIGSRLNRQVHGPELPTDNKMKGQRAIPVIVDGKVYRTGLAELERTELWLRQRIKAFGSMTLNKFLIALFEQKTVFLLILIKDWVKYSG